MPQKSSFVLIVVVVADDMSTREFFVASQHCLQYFWRQTNIKISRDLGALSHDYNLVPLLVLLNARYCIHHGELSISQCMAFMNSNENVY